MAETGKNFTRRKFILVSSAAAASPLLSNITGLPAWADAAETKKTFTKGQKIYYIQNLCVGCQTCRTLCPAKAIRYGDCRNEIDQKKCMHCGTCYRECPVCAISESEI